MLEFILFLLTSLFAYIWFTREHLTLEEVDKKVSKLGKEVTKLDNSLKSQEKRMGAASTQATQAQALLHSKTKV
jgi:predicted  nucleic acid-binding Zn-ribbon protein